MLAASIAVGTLGDADERDDVGEAKLGQHLLRDRELPRATVDQHKIRDRRQFLRLGRFAVAFVLVCVDQRLDVVGAQNAEGGGIGTPFTLGRRSRRDYAGLFPLPLLREKRVSRLLERIVVGAGGNGAWLQPGTVLGWCQAEARLRFRGWLCALSRQLGRDALEPAGQHFAHHRIVVAGRQTFRLDVELAVLVLYEPIDAGDDHRADRIGAHDVAVVVDLDAARHARQTEAVLDAFHQDLLRRGFRHAAAERLARVLLGVIDEPDLGAALRHGNLDPALGLDRQRLGQQRARWHVVRQQDQTRHRLVVVELGDEAIENFADVERPIGLREIGAVAPVLPRPKEEHLDAGVPAFLVRREHVGLLDTFRVDRLVGGDVRQRPQPIAEFRRLLEFELFGRLLHHALIHGAHVLALAAQEADALVDQPAVVCERDFAGAWRRTALDLMQQTRSRPAFVDAVGARAQQERALQHVDGAVDGTGRGERSEVVAFAVAGAAMLHDLRRRVIAGNEDVGERFVVAHQHVEARSEALDQIGFEEQRLGLGADGDELHRHGGCDHPGDAVGVALQARVVRHARLQRPGLADVNHVA